MEQAKNMVINLDNSDIKLHILELVLSHFDDLSIDIAEDFNSRIVAFQNSRYS